MNRKKKENIFFNGKMETFRRTNIYYIYIIFFFGEERKGVYFKLKYLLPYL